MVGVLAQDRAERWPREQLVLSRPQVQHDVGAARLARDGLDGVVAFAGALPRHALLGGQPGAAGGQRHAIGDDEGGVEADAELPDELRVLGGVGGQAS